MKTQINNGGSTKPQINIASFPCEGRQENAAAWTSDSSGVKTENEHDTEPTTSNPRQYRLASEGISYSLKIHRVTPDELKIVKPLVRAGADYVDLSLDDELGLGWDVGNPNSDLIGYFIDATSLRYTLYDPAGRVVFSSRIRVCTETPVCEDWDVAPERDGLTLVHFDEYDSEFGAHVVESHDVPRVEDFCAKVRRLLVGDEIIFLLEDVTFRGLALGYCDDSEDLIGPDCWKSSATLV